MVIPPSRACRIVAKHPWPIRVSHWINVPVLAVMVWSGLLIFWAQDPYKIVVGGVTLIQFFPDWFYRALDLEYGLALGLGWHLAFAWIFVFNGLAYLLAVIGTGEWRHLLPGRTTFADAWQVVRHDLGLRREPLPPAKFNGAQRLAYTGVVALGAGSVLTGLAIAKPTQLAWLTALCGGYPMARLLHFVCMLAFCGFVVIHLAQVARAGWANFQAMVTGFDVEPVESVAATSEAVHVAEPEIAAQPGN